MPLISYFGLTFEHAGYALIFFAAAAESGLFLGLVFPGDTLLIASGVLASQGHLNLTYLLIASFLGAVVGDSVAYGIGRYLGPKIFRMKDSFFFSHENIERSRAFYERHGGKTVFIARFLPVVRTFAPVFAGVGKMPYLLFIGYNILGGFVWANGFTLLGYYAGEKIPGLSRYVAGIPLLILLVLGVPWIIGIMSDKTRREKIFVGIKKLFGR